MANSVGRDAQLSSSVFDGEILQILSTQLSRCLEPFEPQLVRRWRPELDAALSGSVFLLTIGSRGVSPGQEVQNVRYRVLSKREKIALGILTVIFPYTWKRLQETASENRWSESRPQWYRWIRRIDTGWKFVSILNFIVFLLTSKYPKVVDRVLGIPLENISVVRGRAVAFDFMNRQLVWQGLTDFLLFFAPLVDFERLQKIFRRNVANSTLPPTECGICGLDPIAIPFGGPCGHASCYYCIAQKLEDDDDGYPCPNCGEDVTKETLIRLELPPPAKE